MSGFVILATMKKTNQQQSMSFDWDKDALQAQWHVFDFTSTQPLSDIEARYCQHYRLNFGDHLGGVQHRFGYVEVDGYQLATHHYLPAMDKPRGTVLALHGYFDHCGLYSHLIEFCLQRKYAVLVYDLPGHGLSTGGKGEIDDFLEYVRVLTHYVELLEQHLPAPFCLVGSSTGGAIIMEYLAKHNMTSASNPFASILLLAPLVRPANWTSVQLKYKLMRFFVSSVERTFVNSSHDEQFLHFVQYNDPLQNRRVATSWIGALVNWVRRFKKARIEVSPVVIQGGEDETIDWRYNLKMIRRNFKDPRVHFIPEGRHQLANETPEIRRKVFDFMALYLPETPSSGDL